MNTSKTQKNNGALVLLASSNISASGFGRPFHAPAPLVCIHGNQEPVGRSLLWKILWYIRRSIPAVRALLFVDSIGGLETEGPTSKSTFFLLRQRLTSDPPNSQVPVDLCIALFHSCLRKENFESQGYLAEPTCSKPLDLEIFCWNLCRLNENQCSV